MAAILGFSSKWLTNRAARLVKHHAARAGKRWHVESTRAAALEMAVEETRAKAKRTR